MRRYVLFLFRRTLAITILSLFVIGFEAPAQAGVTITTVGTPLFLPADFHMFAAPVGTAADGYAEFGQTIQAILPPPNHLSDPVLGIVPGAPHPGPYDHEIGQGVAANGFVDSTTFTTGDYSNGTGVYLAFMVIPGPGSPTGSSPDFASGPITPNAIFPLTLDAANFTDGAFNDIVAHIVVPAIDQISGFEGLEGHSHINFFLADNFDFASLKIPGNFEYRISLLDIQGNGYHIVAPFQVVPEPSSWVTLATTCLILTGLMCYRRRPRQ